MLSNKEPQAKVQRRQIYVAPHDIYILTLSHGRIRHLFEPFIRTARIFRSLRPPHSSTLQMDVELFKDANMSKHSGKWLNIFKNFNHPK